LSLIKTYGELRDLALSLGLPQVEDSRAWNHPCLRAHGKMWCWWSPYEDAAVFRCDPEERAALMQADGECFFLHPHYRNSALVLARAGHIDSGWAAARLQRDWRDAAPRRWLKTWDAAQKPTFQTPET
jgi:hypothetical protein